MALPVASVASFRDMKTPTLSRNIHLRSPEFSIRCSKPTCGGPSLQISSYMKRPAVCAGYSGDGDRTSSVGIFLGGFILGGLTVGTLGCVYAPEISKAFIETSRNKLMKGIPKLLHDDENILERTREMLTEKIGKLNSAIDDVASHLRTGYDEYSVYYDADEPMI